MIAGKRVFYENRSSSTRNEYVSVFILIPRFFFRKKIKFYLEDVSRQKVPILI